MDLSTSSSANLVADSRIDGFDFKLDLSIDESARQRKRPRCRTRPLEDKIIAIDRVNKGETKAAVGKDMDVPESTLRGWCKSEPKIRAMTRNTLTPESEASSSGASMDMHNAAANHLSDDDGPARKRIKIEPQYPSMVGNTRSKGYNNYSNLLVYSFLQQQHLHTMTQTNDVRLVKNGLEYTKSGINPAVKKMHSISAIAPMQMDSVAKSVPKMSLPPAAEAPAIPVPASPNLHVPVANKNNSVFRLLQQQKEFNGQQSNEQTVQLGKKGWFWQWCKQGGCMVIPTTSTMQNSSTSMTSQNAKEIVDNELESQEGPNTLEEAILHGDKFLQWFNKCPEPSLTMRLQLLQFKYQLDTLKSQTKKKPSPRVKRSRK